MSAAQPAPTDTQNDPPNQSKNVQEWLIVPAAGDANLPPLTLPLDAPLYLAIKAPLVYVLTI